MSTRFKQSMVSAALVAAGKLGGSPLAKDLKARGFTPASMTKAAEELQALRARVDVAKSAYAEAVTELAKGAKKFAVMWAGYAANVRALTTDVGARAALGVATPGYVPGRRVRHPSKPEPEDPAFAATNGAAAPHPVIAFARK